MGTVRCDGLYQSIETTPLRAGEVARTYLRFYADGTVVDVASIGTAEQVADWIARDRGHTQGNYQLAGNELAFAVRVLNRDAERSMIRYHGAVLENELALQWTSEVTGKTGASNFEFVRVDFKSS